MKLKKLTAMIMGAALLTAGLAGCGGTAQTGNTNDSDSASSSAGENTDDSGSSSSSKTTDAIRIATKPMTEQFILSEMLKLIIEDSTDYSVEITKGIGGGTNNIHPAMEKGEFDLYPEYTSSGWVMVLDHEAGGMDDEEMFAQLNAEYNEKFDMSWVGLYGFNNTYAVVVRRDAAEQYNLKTTSELAAVSEQLIFGGNPDYIERADGFGLLADTYGLNFKDVKDIDIGLKYEALRNGDIDVTNGYTTDAQIGAEDVLALEDDLHLQANYFCSTIVRNEALKKYPGLEDALMKMNGLLSDKEMAQLNYQVEVEGKDEVEVAKEFLIEKGIIEG